MSFGSVIGAIGKFVSANPLQTIGAGLQVASAFSQASAQKRATESGILNAQAEQKFSQERTDLEIQRFNRMAREFGARQTAVASKAGRTTKTGTVARLLEQQADIDALDAEIIRRGGDIQTGRFQQQEDAFRTASRTQPFTTALTGGLGAINLLATTTDLFS